MRFFLKGATQNRQFPLCSPFFKPTKSELPTKAAWSVSSWFLSKLLVPQQAFSKTKDTQIPVAQSNPPFFLSLFCGGRFPIPLNSATQEAQPNKSPQKNGCPFFPMEIHRASELNRRIDGHGGHGGHGSSTLTRQVWRWCSARTRPPCSEGVGTRADLRAVPGHSKTSGFELVLVDFRGVGWF